MTLDVVENPAESLFCSVRQYAGFRKHTHAAMSPKEYPMLIRMGRKYGMNSMDDNQGVTKRQRMPPSYSSISCAYVSRQPGAAVGHTGLALIYGRMFLSRHAHAPSTHLEVLEATQDMG